MLQFYARATEVTGSFVQNLSLLVRVLAARLPHASAICSLFVPSRARVLVVHASLRAHNVTDARQRWQRAHQFCSA